MLLNNLMEGESSPANNLISSIKRFNNDGREHGTIKALLKNFILPETDMAVKDKQSDHEKCVYTIPIQSSLSPKNARTKSISDAQQAFLNSTVNIPQRNLNKEPTLHYAQIAITTESEDTRSTGGGKDFEKMPSDLKNLKGISTTLLPADVASNVKKKVEQQQRKVIFKIKNVSTTYRRPPLATKTTMTIKGNTVSELTKKFNDLIKEPNKGPLKQSKLAKTIEDLQVASRCSVSNSSTPSSTLSSSPNIKIVVRHRRSSKKRNSKKRCSSMDSIDKLFLTEGSSGKVRIIRSKSDGTRIPKSPKKRLKYHDSSEQQSGSDSVDGTPTKFKATNTTTGEDEQHQELNVVKDVIKKFECEIIAHSSNLNNTLKKQHNLTQTSNASSIPPRKEKPKVPEKKSSLVLTKNLVVKDGVPKIKTIKPVLGDTSLKQENNKIYLENIKKKEPIYDKKKYKTNYIHPEKLTLHPVEIIQEDADDCLVPQTTMLEQTVVIGNETEKEDRKDINSSITPNESFLWRRKSNSQVYSDCDKTVSEGPYGFVSITINESTSSYEEETNTVKESQADVNKESHNGPANDNLKCDSNSDFETNLVEAFNKEVLVGCTTQTKKEELIEDDYEVLEPRDTDNIVIIPVKSIDRTSKINCPLPEIPKESPQSSPSKEENIYQSLLEARSHPEGDESSLHNYELCFNQLEERTRGDGDSDDGYEYCKSPIKPYCLTSSSGIQIAEDYQPYGTENNNKNYAISKSVSGASTVSYEKIGPERIYEKIPPRLKSKEGSPNYSRSHSFVASDYSGYNGGENIYDTIKQGDGTSLSHCYESIPNSPSMVKLRNNLKKQLASAVQKRLSFDNVSNISQSTLSSEQKTNSIYGQRSVMSYNGQEIAFQVPSSTTSVSDRSDRSDDWVDVSDEEKTDEQKIVIVRERSRGRKSPISWSQKVRHQWQKTPKQKSDDKVSVSSPTKVYIETNARSPHYSPNDETRKRLRYDDFLDDKVRLIKVLEQTCWLCIKTVLQDGEIEVQDLVAFIDGDSSDSGHLYESLEPAPTHPAHAAHVPHAGHASSALHALPLEDDFDSFDSDTDSEDHDKSPNTNSAPAVPSTRLPSPPIGGGPYTLTKIASAAQKKMRQIKRNLTKRYSVAMDGKTLTKSSQPNGTYDTPKTKTKAPIYANCEKSEVHHVYANISFNDSKNMLNKTENPMTKITGNFKEELKTVIGEKRHSNGDVPPPLPEKPPPEKLTIPTNDSKKDSGTLSRKTYFSFKSRFRRASSLAVDVNSDVPSALKITNSTFYLNDSMDGDSGFSNCSDSGAASAETLSASSRRRDGTRAWAESSPCLAPAPLERPAQPPPPPPTAPHVAHTHTDLSAVNEELKRLLPTLSRKDKSPRARTSWYAECGADSSSQTLVTTPSSWYAEAGLYQAGNISSSSGASSGSHPASPLPHSLFTHEPLYQFYNAAKVESTCRESGDSDSDGYEAGAAPARPSAMALVAPRGPARTLWCEVPEVLNSAVLSSLAPAQKRLQEAKFEVLTSEASYLNSLNVLEAHFISHPAFRDPQVLPPEDWEALFGSILPVRRCSQMLMGDLEKCWQENILLQDICDIVRRHAEARFHVYVKYCEQQAAMVRTLQRLRDRPVFAAALHRLESHPACQSLSLHSFLLLPMQRVTRLPLLLDAVLRSLQPADREHDACVLALATLNHFVSQCNEGARNTERIEEMFRLAKAIEFPPQVRDPPLLGPACSRRDRKPVRWLVRSGEVTHLIWKADELKLTFGKKFHKVQLYLFLFNDLLVITKKKGEESFMAVDWCARSLLETCGGEAAPPAAKHAMLLTLLENRDARTVEMLVSCASETEARRWGEALAPPRARAGEAVYAGWDCPQVAALHAYAPAQPDELPLAEGDIVNVTRKTSEGWYYGERTRDGEAGWFPGSYTVEIASAHVRARNLRQRYRLLALSGTYLGNRKRAA